MRITIFAVGKTDALFEPLQVEYLKRLKPMTSLTLEYIAEEKGPAISKKNALFKEEERILKRLKWSEHLVLLDLEGAPLTSPQLANKIQSWRNDGHIKHICCCIGGPWGFSEEFKRLAKDKISLSRMTFTHQMVRIILLEQIYRSFMILGGQKYHK